MEILLIYGVGLFYQAAATNVCPGNDVKFMCQTSKSAFNWAVTPAGGNTTICVALKGPEPLVADRTCGPNDEFSVSISGDGSTSTLSTQSVDESLNETRIQCLDGDVDQTICILGQYAFSSRHHKKRWTHL